MNNLAVIQVPSLRFSSQEIQGQTIYHGVDEFADQVGRRVRDHLASAGVGCGPVRRSFKPAGSGFIATSMSGDFVVSVSVERGALPEAEITIWADPRGDAARSWSWFEPLFQQAVESEFGDSLRWMSIDDYVEHGPSV